MRCFFSLFSVVCGSVIALSLLACGGGSKTTQAADFAIAASPTTMTLTPGAAAQTVSVVATAVNGFAGSVTVTPTGLPAGVTASPASLTLAAGAAQTMTLTAASTAAAATATLTLTGTSGALTHAVTTAITVTPPPDFSLSVTPASLSLVVGGQGSPVSVLATASNSFASPVDIVITGLPAGVTANPTRLKLTPGTAQSTTLTAAASAAAGTSPVTFTGTSGSLTHTADLALTLTATAQTNAPDVTTYHYDNARDGLNAAETILTPANVNSTQFGLIGTDTVDGKVDAQPLYLANVTIGRSLHNVLYVATEHGSVYAFDADSGSQLWTTSVLGSGETPSDDHGCDQVTPEIGITATPVIDRKQGANGTVYTVGMSKEANGTYHHRLHALDLTTGQETAGSPTEISGSYPGSGANSQGGNVVFDPGQYAERTGLLLLNGTVYLAWTSHCDNQPYTGWVMGYSESTLKQTQVLNLTPNGNAGAIWMSGDGLAGDSGGNIYLLDANGTFDMGFDGNGFPTMSNFGNGILKLSADTTGTLKVSDYFQPFNTDDETAKDLDLGSGGEILLPDVKDSSGNTRHLLVGAGKDMHIYLADRDGLGKFNSKTSDNGNLYQDVPSALSGPVFSTPAYFNGVLYYGAVGDMVKAIRLTDGKLAQTASSMSPTAYPYPGTTPVVTANGTENGIVWALESNGKKPAVLHAYDATNLANELYDSSQAAGGRDGFGNGNKYITLVAVNGKVYVGTQTGVAVFGLLPH